MNEPIIIRHSTDDDRGAIRELAALDSRRAPDGDALLAFIGTELRAALPLDGGTPLADPFHRTAEIVELLRVRATQSRQRPSHAPGRLAALRPRAA
jgi:hypothetical protein